MEKRELKYFIEHLLANHINNNRETAILLNSEILLAFVELKIISVSLYSECLELIRDNTLENITKAEELLAEEFEITLE